MSTEFINDQWRLPNAWNGSESNVNKQSNYSMDFLTTTRIPDITGLGLGTSVDTFSISLWFNKSNMNYGIVFSTYSGSGSYNTSGVSIELNADGTITFFNSVVNTTSQAQYSANTWYNLVVTSDGTTVKMYVNGSTVSLNSTTVVARNFTNVWINSAKYSTSNFGIIGQIDGVSIFNYALSSSQITTLYGSSSTGIGNPMSLSPKPVAYYPLGDQDAFNGANYLVPNSSLKDYVFSFSGGSVSTSSTYSELDGANKLTISFWAKSTSAATSVPFTIGTSPNRSLYIIIQSSGRIVFRKNENGDNTYLRADSGTPHDGNWNHIMISMDLTATSKGAIFFNGNNITYLSTLDTNAIQTSTGSLLVGDSTNFSGEISNLAIWSGTDLRNNVATIYNNGSPNDLNNNGLTAPTTWYKLDASATYDGSNWTISDDSTNSNTGTSSGMTQANLVQSDLSFTSGYSPYALDFDGTNDYIQIPYNANLTPQNGNFTISAWINTDNLSGWHPIWCTQNLTSSTIPLVALHTYGNKVRATVGGSTNNPSYSGGWALLLDSTQSLTTSTWYHIAVSYNMSGNAQIYINGSADNSGPIENPQTSWNTGDRFIGEGEGYWDGRISNISIWNTNLTSTQVTELYNEGVPSNLNNHSAYSNLVSWWQLGSNSSYTNKWICLDEKGTNNGESVNMTEADIVDGVGSSANGVSSGMSDNIVGDAPYSSANSLSINMDVLDRTEDTPA